MVRRLVFLTALAFLAAAAPAAANIHILTGPGELSSTNAASVSFTFEDDDPSSTLECRLYAPPATPPAFAPCGTSGTGSFTASPAEGPYVFTVRSDEYTSTSRSFEVDRTAPSLGGIELWHTEGYRGGVADDVLWYPDVKLKVVVTDDDDRARCRRDGGAWVDCATFGDPYVYWNGAADGTHTLEAQAIDKAGNVQTVPTAKTFRIDTVAPDTTFTQTPAAEVWGFTHTFGVATSEPGSSFWCFNEDGVRASYACIGGATHTITAVTGTRTHRVAARDAAGNEDPTPATYTWKVLGLSKPGPAPDISKIPRVKVSFPKVIGTRADLVAAHKRAVAACKRIKAKRRRKACQAKAAEARFPTVSWKLPGKVRELSVTLIKVAEPQDRSIRRWKLDPKGTEGSWEWSGLVDGKPLPPGKYHFAIDGYGTTAWYGGGQDFRVR